MLRSLLARQVSALFRGLGAVQLSAARQQVHLAASSQQPQPPSSEQHQQQPKYRGVKRDRSRWCAQITIPKAMLPGSQKRVMQQIYSYGTPEAAAAAVDQMLLALHGRGNELARHLNFPADSYSEEEIAEQQNVLLAKHPGLQLGQTANQPGLLGIEDRSGALAAAARAAERVGSVYDGSSQLAGVEEVNVAASDLKYRMRIEVQHNTSRVQYQLQPLTYLAAGCAYDMARIVLHGRQHSVNFPPDVYSSSDIEAMRQDMQVMAAHALAAAAARRRPPPRNYHNIQARAAADAAVAAEVAAAAVAGHSSSFGTMGVYPNGSVYQVNVWGQPPGSSKRVTFQPCYDSAVAAACAADMMRLALGRLAVNLPGHAFLPERVAAMAAWLQLEWERRAAVPAAIAAAARPKHAAQAAAAAAVEPAAVPAAAAASRRRRAARQRAG